MGNLGLFQIRSSFARMLFMHTLYLRALKMHGATIEFSVRWGQNLATFRNIYVRLSRNKTACLGRVRRNELGDLVGGEINLRDPRLIDDGEDARNA